MLLPGGKVGTEISLSQSLNVVLGSVKTAPSGTYHAFRFHKYAARYIADVHYRFNRRFQSAEMLPRLAVVFPWAKPYTRQAL